MGIDLRPMRAEDADEVLDVTIDVFTFVGRPRA